MIWFIFPKMVKSTVCNFLSSHGVLDKAAGPGRRKKKVALRNHVIATHWLHYLRRYMGHHRQCHGKHRYLSDVQVLFVDALDEVVGELSLCFFVFFTKFTVYIIIQLNLVMKLFEQLNMHAIDFSIHFLAQHFCIVWKELSTVFVFSLINLDGWS